jgi:hypothetical protein
VSDTTMLTKGLQPVSKKFSSKNKEAVKAQADV